jgi:hypothetical protein
MSLLIVLIVLLSEIREITESAYSLALVVPQRSEDQGEHIGQPGKPHRRVILMMTARQDLKEPDYF